MLGGIHKWRHHYTGGRCQKIFTPQKWGHHTVFWDRQLKFSANARFIIVWNLTKFKLYLTTFFNSFQEGTKGKMLKIYFFMFLSFGPTLESVKKSCLKELKFCEVSENPKSRDSIIRKIDEVIYGQNLCCWLFWPPNNAPKLIRPSTGLLFDCWLVVCCCCWLAAFCKPPSKAPRSTEKKVIDCMNFV